MDEDLIEGVFCLEEESAPWGLIYRVQGYADHLHTLIRTMLFSTHVSCFYLKVFDDPNRPALG